MNDKEYLLLFDGQYPCWTDAMAELSGKDPAVLSRLVTGGFLAKDGADRHEF